jgi:anti-sigma regulatory factor (Ser/Thr protein kinase)
MGAPAPLHRRLAFTSRAIDDRLGVQRARVRSFLADDGLTGALADDVVLVMSELVANGHQASLREGAVAVRVTVEPSKVTVEVTNDRPLRTLDAAHFARPSVPYATAEHSHGLAVVALLSTRLAIEPTARATSVRAEMART